MNELERADAAVPTVLAVGCNLSEYARVIGVPEGGWNLAVAEDRAQALERAAFLLPSLILIDVTAPAEEALAICRELKAQPTTSAIPVIATTRLTTPGLASLAFAAGAVDCVPASIDGEELLARMRMHVGLRAGQQRLALQNTLLQQEIAWRQQSGITLAASEQRYRRVFETASEGVLLFALESGRVVDANPALLEMLQTNHAKLCGQILWEVEPFCSLASLPDITERLRSEGAVQHPCVVLAAKNQPPIEAEVIGRSFSLDGEQVAQCSFRNMTAPLKTEAQTRHWATHDTITGLVNRPELENRLAEAVLRARGRGTQVAVLMLDLDHFKDVNESLGHHAGDRLLKAVAQRLTGVLREGDFAARLGGDEFAVLVADLADASEAATVAERVLGMLGEPFAIDGHRLRSSGSIGVSLWPGDASNADVLLRTAETALFEAKRSRRGSYRFFSPALQEAAKHRLRLSSDVQEAWAQGTFTLNYQPQIALPSGDVIGVEALLRWRHPERGYVAPAQFIPLLNELGMLGEVGRWVLTTACRQARAWRGEGLGAIRVAVNLSAPEFYDDDIVSSVQHALRESGLPAQALEVEITESLPLGDADNAVRLMQALKRLGIGLLLDDFGTGWSSLSHLRRFPLDRIKIDRSFVCELTSQPRTSAVVQSIVGLAANLGFGCIAEGVETAEQRDHLRRLGCSEMQGFLFSKPLPAEAAGKLLKARVKSLEIEAHG